MAKDPVFVVEGPAGNGSGQPGKASSPKQGQLADRRIILRQLLEQTRIIPAVRSPEFLIPAATAPGKIIYFLCGNPENLPQMVDVVVSNGKVAIVNLDLVSGLSRDAEAIGFLARRKVQGIISTHLEPLRAARHLGLFAIERTFLLDSAALSSSLRSIDQFVPDALEVLPAAVAPKIVARLRECHSDLPVIAGGLVQVAMLPHVLLSRFGPRDRNSVAGFFQTILGVHQLHVFVAVFDEDQNCGFGTHAMPPARNLFLDDATGAAGMHGFISQGKVMLFIFLRR
jgi:glycerol uptake operon antiterminator